MVSRRGFFELMAGASIVGCGGENVPKDGAPVVADIPAPSAASSDSPRPAAGGRVRAIKVGVVLPLTGPNAEFGNAAQKGIDLARDELRESGGVTLDLIVSDDQTNSMAAVEAVGNLAEAGVVAILGEITSAVTKACAVIAMKKKVPLLTPTSTNRDITRVGSYAFRACFIDEAQGAFAARYIAKTLGATRIGLVFASDMPYSQTLAQAFKRTLSQLGGSLVVETAFSNKATDFTSVVADLKAKKPDIVFAPVYSDQMVPLANRAMSAGIGAERFFGGDGLSGDASILALEGARYIDHWHEDVLSPRSQAFVSRFRKLHGTTPDSIAALSYDSAHLLAAAAGRAVDGQPRSIRDALAETRDFEGATGKIAFDSDRDPLKPGCVIAISKGATALEAVVEPT